MTIYPRPKTHDITETTTRSVNVNLSSVHVLLIYPGECLCLLWLLLWPGAEPASVGVLQELHLLLQAPPAKTV